MIGVYVGRRGIEEMLRELDESIGVKGGEERTIIGDFNARIGREGGDRRGKMGSWKRENERKGE